MGAFIFELKNVGVVSSPVAYAWFRTATAAVYSANCEREKV